MKYLKLNARFLFVLIANFALPKLSLAQSMGRDYDESDGSLIKNWWVLAIIVLTIIIIREIKRSKEIQKEYDSESRMKSNNSGVFFRFVILFNNNWFCIDWTCYLYPDTKLRTN